MLAQRRRFRLASAAMTVQTRGALFITAIILIVVAIVVLFGTVP
jgi:hypothetical protein